MNPGGTFYKEIIRQMQNTEHSIKLLTWFSLKMSVSHTHTEDQTRLKELKRHNKMQHVNHYWLLVPKRAIKDFGRTNGTYECRLDN